MSSMMPTSARPPARRATPGGNRNPGRSRRCSRHTGGTATTTERGGRDHHQRRGQAAEHEREPERGDRETENAGCANRVVNRTISMEGGESRERNGHHKTREQRSYEQPKRDPHPLEDDVHNGHLSPDRGAEVAVQRVPEVIQVAAEEGLIEAQFTVQRADARRCRVQAELSSSGIAGDHAHQHIDDEQHQRKQRHCLGQAPEDEREASHRPR